MLDNCFTEATCVILSVTCWVCVCTALLSGGFLTGARLLQVCAGLRFRPKLDRYAPNSAEVDSTSVPGGDFKFVCVGYAAYDAEKMRQQQAESKKNPTAPIELPYCEGACTLTVPAHACKEPARTCTSVPARQCTTVTVSYSAC